MAIDQITDTPGEPKIHSEQKVSWAELFLDLVWVFAVTQIAGTLAGATGWGDVAHTLLLLAPLWWGWIGVTLLGNAAGARLDSVRGRALIFVMAGCGLAMAVAVPQAWADHGMLFAVSYTVLRLLLWLGMRRQPTFGGLRLEPYAVSLFVSGPLFLAGAMLTGSWRTAIWAVAALVGIFSPYLLRRRLDHVRFETSHLPERFGLFLIIALGETVVAVGGQAANGGLEFPAAAALASSFVVIIALWWTYFHYGAPAARHSLSTDPRQARIARDVFSYAHFLYVAAIICVAVGLKKTIAHPLDVPHKVTELLLAPGVGLYLAGFCYARWRMFGAAGLPRFVASLCCFGLAAAAPVLPQLTVAVLIAALLVVLNVFEAWRVESGRAILLLQLPRRKS